ncbi:MAG: EamA family transporter [Cyclobacteriaceae bacterium]|nr:EamA family transporter [Cyclobacteriaceae bacterium]
MKKTRIEAAITLVLMAAVPVVIKFTAANTITIGLFRLSLAAFLILLFLKPQRHIREIGKSMILPLVSIGVLFAMHWLTYFWSIKLATASIGILGMSSYGIHLIFLGWTIRHQKPGLYDFIALTVAILGTYFIVPEFSLSNNTTLGLLLGIFSGLCFAILPILHQQYQYIHEPLRIFSQFIFALLVFVFFIPWSNWHIQEVDWWALLYLAVFGTFIAHTLWVRVTTRLSTLVSSLIFYLIVPMTMVLSHFWLGETMPLEKVIGASLIVSGNVLSFYGRLMNVPDRG